MNDAGVLRIAKIRVRYRLKIPEGTRDELDRALAAHVANCPVAQTLLPCVDIEWEAEVSEV